jgi:hypothetical protein
MRFSLVHPSRQRARRAEEALLEWRGKASGAHELEHILSVDADDPELPAYRTLAERHASRLVVDANRSIVDAVNRGAAAATGDLLIVVSDDFGCPSAWDASLAGIAGERRDLAIHVGDGHAAPQMTLPIVGRELYRRLGYLYHPSYFSMFADDDITGVAAALGSLVDARQQLVFPHRHFSFGLSEVDATYLRQNATDKWWHGWRAFAKRRATGFGLRAPSMRLAAQLLRIDAYYAFRVAGSRVRRLWLLALPERLRPREQRLRDAVMAWARRIAAVDAPS